MKKILTTFVSVAMMIGLVAAAQASAASSPGRTTSAPPVAKPSRPAAKLSVLENHKRLDRQQLKALGLKPLSGHQLAVVKQLGPRRRATSGPRPHMSAPISDYTWHNSGFSWADKYYSDYTYYYNSNLSYYYYYYYDNWKTCTTSGTGCLSAHAYTYYYYEDLYYYGTWYYYYYGTYGPYYAY